MEQTRFPVYKSKPMKPLLYTCLTTSTPESHQISKRIKGLLGFSEHYKGNRVDYPFVSSSFPPLRTRDYRKARELTLEIWDPMVQTAFLERFLKSQKNVQHIQIKVLTEEEFERQLLVRLCEILNKTSGLTRVHIDFNPIRTEQVKLELREGIRCMRQLPRLKDFNVTLQGEQVLPYSVSLTKVGFAQNQHLLTVEAASTLQKLIEKTLKFTQLDTIRIYTKNLNFRDEFLDDLLFLISKLQNFRELDFNYSKDRWNDLPSHFLDSLAAKAPKIEILKLGLPGEKDAISLLKHPLFKAKSLRRTSLSLWFEETWATSEYFEEIFDLLGEIPSLYELSLRFFNFYKVDDRITVSHMEKISKMTSLRKLRIVFDFTSTTISEKQAGDIFRPIFNRMHFLEELELRIPRKCLGLTARDIQGLPRLKKATLEFNKSSLENGADPTYVHHLPKAKRHLITTGEVNDMETVMEILGNCCQLRELDLKMFDCVSGSEEMAIKVSESLSKLKRLQVFRIDAIAYSQDSNMTLEAFQNLFETFHKLRDLQDLKIHIGYVTFYWQLLQRGMNFLEQLRMNKKYRLYV